jgi:hypothetical protein
VALAAGLAYPHRLAGIVSVSGWWPYPSSSSSSSSCKSSDDDVSPLAARRSAPCGQTADEANGSFGVTTPPPLVPVYFSYGTSDATVAARLSRASAQLLQRALRPAGDGVAGGVVVAAVQRKKHPPNPAETHAVACAILAMLSRGDSSLAASASVHRWRRSRRGG